MNRDDKKQTRSEGLEQQTEPSTRRAPWWLSIIFAIATYCTLKYILPELSSSNQTLQQLFQIAPTAAPVLTIPFLLLAAKQLYDIPGEDDDDQDPEEK